MGHEGSPPVGAAPAPDDAAQHEVARRMGVLKPLMAMMSSALRRGLPCVGHLRVQTRGGRRDVLLSDRSVPDGPVPVVDWRRAPLAEVFFEAREGDEYELQLGRQHLEGTVLMRALLDVQRGELVRVVTDDWVLDPHDSQQGQWLAKPRLAPSLLGRPMGERTRPASVMAVQLDPHQTQLVQRPPGTGLVVLGDAGYGKTTVALHRVVWLAQHAGTRPVLPTLIVVPTEGLRRLTRRAVERFELRNIEVATFASWAETQARRVFDDLPPRTSVDTPLPVTGLKRHPALASAIAAVASTTQAMHDLDEADTEGPATRRSLLHLFGDRTLLEAVVDQSDGALRPSVCGQTLAHTRLQFSETTEDAMAGVDAERLKALDGRRLDEGTPNQDADSIDPEDFAVLFALTHAKTGRDRGPGGKLSKYAHVVLDEAQELAPIELALVGRAVARGGSLTVAGDAQQRIDPASFFAGWPAVMHALGRTDASAYEQARLQESYRCPPAVEALARRVIGRPREPDTTPTHANPSAVRRTRCLHACHRAALMAEVLVDLMGRDRHATVAIVATTPALARGLHAELSRGLTAHLALQGDVRFSPGVQVTCAAEVRGLEFDYVVIPDASPSTYPDRPDARRALYVVLTRAKTAVWMLTTSSWSPLLSTDVTDCGAADT